MPQPETESSGGFRSPPVTGVTVAGPQEGECVADSDTLSESAAIDDLFGQLVGGSEEAVEVALSQFLRHFRSEEHPRPTIRGVWHDAFTLRG